MLSGVSTDIRCLLLSERQLDCLLKRYRRLSWRPSQTPGKRKPVKPFSNMSFGYGVSDIITVAQLAYNVWCECRDAPRHFGHVTTEAANLEIVLRNARDTIAEQGLDDSKRADLSCLIEGCNGVLSELKTLLSTHKSLGTKSKNAWDRIMWSRTGWAARERDSIRLRLISNTVFLISFNIGIQK